MSQYVSKHAANESQELQLKSKMPNTNSSQAKSLKNLTKFQKIDSFQKLRVENTKGQASSSR